MKYYDQLDEEEIRQLIAAVLEVPIDEQYSLWRNIQLGILCCSCWELSYMCDCKTNR